MKQKDISFIHNAVFNDKGQIFLGLTISKKRITLNDVLHLLEDDTDFQEADVFMTGPEDATKSDDDSVDKDLGAT
ncbi:hypothetical protein DPMN_027295 [Dreissena polymorpha]|uniref:Uncharacterized protein n=1 Tax=Dreissena polymorpha TaxID=45954 RepID=A0A9D4LUY4_DREPO|nr:hypothetical protein DPMN_027295 [Dreissena polymorpha]